MPIKYVKQQPTNENTNKRDRNKKLHQVTQNVNDVRLVKFKKKAKEKNLFLLLVVIKFSSIY